jgi:hypothetical protein
LLHNNKETLEMTRHIDCAPTATSAAPSHAAAPSDAAAPSSAAAPSVSDYDRWSRISNPRPSMLNPLPKLSQWPSQDTRFRETEVVSNDVVHKEWLP